jgi:hypothetical protein
MNLLARRYTQKRPDIITLDTAIRTTTVRYIYLLCPVTNTQRNSTRIYLAKS